MTKLSWLGMVKATFDRNMNLVSLLISCKD